MASRLAENLARFTVPPPVLFIFGFAENHEIPGPYLTKPFLPSVLVEAVGQIVNAPAH